MRKPVLILSLFAVIATIAVVYAMQSNRPNITNVTKIIPIQDKNQNVLVEWKLANPYMLRQNGFGDAYLDLRVTGKTIHGAERKPLNLVLVIDRSGSMGDENKLGQVKEAAVAIVNQMNTSDQLAIVVYDDTASTLLPSSKIESASSIRELLYSLSPGSGTNLAGGLQQGFEEARKNFRSGVVNRVILLSDGLANVGIIDPAQIGALAQQIREHSISVSTMGVGIDFNENLMANIADHSGGNYYYISKEINMADVFRREWNLMRNQIANNATATLELASGVEVADVAGFQWNVQNRKLKVEIPDIYSGETKRVLIHLRAPAAANTVLALGKAEFSCTDITTDKPKMFVQSFHPEIRVIEDVKTVAANYDEEIQSKVAAVDASKKMEEAYLKFESGDRDGAFKIANETNQQLKALGYIGNKEQISRYDNFVNDLASPAPMEPQRQKDILKKQKAADRNAQQSSSQ